MPQAVFVELNCDSRILSAEVDGDIGGMPIRVWEQRRLRWSIRPMSAAAANDLLANIKPLAERIVDGYELEWDGTDYVGAHSDDAQEAREAIEWLCAESTSDFRVVDASDWYAGFGSLRQQADHFRITAASTDEELDLVASIHSSTDLEPGECDLIEGMRKYLGNLRDALY